jgi:hypothetical protein
MHELTITDEELDRFGELERRIEVGIRSFLDVGAALAEIRSERLYREAYKTFEEYCNARWGFTASRGRQLIAAVEAIASLPADLPVPERATQASALARVSEEDRAAVWMDALDEADDQARDVTCADIERAAKRLASNPRSQSDGERNIEEVSDLFRQITASISTALQIAEKLSATSAREWMLTSGSALSKHLRDARDHVSSAKPAGICPECNGDRCRKCLDTGWVNKARMSTMKKR